jgi:serine protease
MRARFAFLFLSVIVSAVLLHNAHGQSPTGSVLDIRENVGLPAVEEGVVADESRAPGTRETLLRAGTLTRTRIDSTGTAYAPGRVIVKFKSAATMAARMAAMSSLKSLSVKSGRATLAARPEYANFDIMQIDPNEDAEAVANELSARPDVEYAQPAYRLHTMFVPNDALYQSLQWNLRLINMERAWDIQLSLPSCNGACVGSSIIVAVLDTGIAYGNSTITASIPSWCSDPNLDLFDVAHCSPANIYPDLGQVTIPYAAATQLVGAGNTGRIVKPRDFIWGTLTPLDFDGHGTHVSGTIGQLTNDSIGTAGVAFNVKLMPVKVIDSMWDDLWGSPHQGTDDIVATGIRYAADNGAKVLNMSIGRTGPPAPVIEDAIRYAVSKGCFIAIAAGNDFGSGNPVEVVSEIASRVQGAVSVAAVDPQRQHAVYSSAGNYVELAAPGGIPGGQGNFVWQQTFDFNFTDTFLQPPAKYGPPRFDVLAYVGYIGTSMATPHVSGLAAMLMQQGITDPAAIEAAMELAAIDLGSPGRDALYGYGLIDARNTLRGLGLAK